MCTKPFAPPSRRPRRLRPAFLLAFLPLLWAGPARGVVVDRLGGGNTTAPADDPGWNNLGTIWVGGGVYLGGGWVLTALHVGSGTGFTLGGTTYQTAAGTGHLLSNKGVAGVSAYADLYLYQIDGRPDVPAISIASTGPAIGDTVRMIGFGVNQAATETAWHVEGTTWSVSPPATDPNRSGFTTVGTKDKTWGDNVVAGRGWVSEGPDGHDFMGFATVFDRNAGAIADEGQVVWGDSGGGVFVKQAGQWNLAGIIIGNDNFSGQPSNTAVFGNASYMAELSFYHDQIVAITVPEPGAGVQVVAGAAAAGLVWLVRRRGGRGG